MIGTTGFSDAQKAEIAAHAEHIAIVMAPNMSVGVNVVLKLLDVAARALAEGFDVEIVEAHHRHKVDAPSGTALKMGEVVAAAQGKSLDTAAAYDRDGERAPRHHRLRLAARRRHRRRPHGLFAGTGERIEITHRSTSRATYAEGSLRAARFLAGQPQACTAWTRCSASAGRPSRDNPRMTRPASPSSGRRATPSRAASPCCFC